MKPISPFRAYAYIVGLLGAFVLFSLPGKAGSEGMSVTFWPGALALLALYLFSASWVVKGLQGGAVLRASPILLFSLLLIAGSHVASLAAALQVAYTNLCVRKLRDERVAFNVGQTIVSVALAGLVYRELGGIPGRPEQNSLVLLSWWLPCQLAAAHLTYILSNTWFCSTYLALRDHRSPWLYWRANYLPMVWRSFATPVAAFVLARLFLAHEYLGVVLLFCLMLVERLDAKAKLSITRSRDRTIESLLAISGVTKPYSQEEAAERTRLAQEMGRHLGLSQTRLERLREAILLHNVGYVGLDPSMLRRRGPLTTGQFDKVRRHPIIGARVLLRVPWLREVAWIVLCHHERPDGRGYPLRLNAGEAPVEAYIVSAVEGYCSLKYGREHQEALGSEGAFREIVSHAGTRYDRAAVATLARALAFPVPHQLLPYLRTRHSKGDPHLKNHHLRSITPSEDPLPTERLGLFASFPNSQAGPSLMSALRRGRRHHLSSQELFRGRLFGISISLFTLALLLAGQDFEHLGWAGNLTSPLIWASLVAFASLLCIRLPGGASVTAAAGVCLAAALIEGPLLGAALGAMAGAVSGTIWKQEKPWRPWALAASYAAASLLAGLTSRAAGGLPHSQDFLSAPWILPTIGSLGAVVVFCLIETGAMSYWSRPAPLGPAPTSGTEDANEPAELLAGCAARSKEEDPPRAAPEEGVPNAFSPPLPTPLSLWDRWRANYWALFPEPLAYPAAGLLMALAHQAIGFWSVGVVLVYPVLWSHFRLEERLRLSDSRLRLLLSISQAIDERHHYTQGHSLRVGLWAGALAQKLGYSPEYSRQLRLAGVLHDLGKASWTDDMLEKPRRLTPTECGLKEEHPVLSARVAHTSFPVAEPPILQHHEDWDGSGYPHGVEGPQMNAGARIVRVADTLDAISSGRPYKLKEGRKDAVAEILRCAYTDFDPAVAASLAAMSNGSPAGGEEVTVRRIAERTLAGVQAALGRLASRREPNARGEAELELSGESTYAARRGSAAGETTSLAADLLASRVRMTKKGREALLLAVRRHEHDGSRRPHSGRIPPRLDFHELRRLARHPHRVSRGMSRWGVSGRARAILFSHHERWDGGGLPRGLRGEEIPLGARILALARAYEQLTSPMPFRRPLAAAAAAKEILARGGSVFDPELAEILFSAVAEGWPRTVQDQTAMITRHPIVPSRSTGLPPRARTSSRDVSERLMLHCRRLAAWAEELGIAGEHAELLLFRHEMPRGKGPQGVDWRELTPSFTRYKLELLLCEVLRHHRRPLNPGILAHALRQMEWFAGWAAPHEEIARLRRDARSPELPPLVSFAEWDRLSGGVELGGEWARDEAILFAYYLWATGALVPLPREAELVTVSQP